MATKKTNGDGESAKEYIVRVAKERKQPLTSVVTDVSTRSGIARRTLQVYVDYGVPMSAKTARRLQTWSGGAISAAKTLGL